MKKGRDSVMLCTMVLNASVVSNGVLVAPGLDFFLGTTSRMVVGY